MKRSEANVNSNELYLPKEVFDSDGEGDENWKDDTVDAQIEESFEYFDEASYRSPKNNLIGERRSDEYLKRKLALVFA